jgi:hypothetical protein
MAEKKNSEPATSNNPAFLSTNADVDDRHLSETVSSICTLRCWSSVDVSSGTGIDRTPLEDMLSEEELVPQVFVASMGLAVAIKMVVTRPELARTEA